MFFRRDMLACRRRKVIFRKALRAGAGQCEKLKRRDQLSKPNVLHPQKCLHFEGEGYLAEES
ncbi:hypothetical protein GCA01S_095_00120 [Parageobacillus caldoxylosilyticus NBRC 107762]|uniref:Uncharacterized protein n=1 Tax=Parageobacillus caldoxylosilyticus NBRC 107762 TaxID=1220594 RepID=A0A023DKH5_9BACL|nr:hypothetical protein GCA01S_095_00120 [Parageobacillus caldoxylosilyticus NBRC 107762]